MRARIARIEAGIRATHTAQLPGAVHATRADGHASRAQGPGVSGDTGLGQSDASDTGLERPQVRPLVHDSSTVGRAPSSPGMPSRRADLSFPISIEPLNPKP